jgi:Protein of unknown function (DUF2927)
MMNFGALQISRLAGQTFRIWRRPLRAVVAFLVIAIVFSATLAAAEDPEITKRRAAERQSFTDAEIVDGFFKVTFGAEFHVAGRVDRIRKYDGPVRVYVDNRARNGRSAQVAAVVGDISRRVRNLNIAMTGKRGEANTIVTLVRDRNLARTIRSLYGAEQARTIQRTLQPQCLSSFRKDDNYRIVHSNVILVADVGDFIFFDCVYEELLQALGPINDDASVPWSMFNDNVEMGFFDLYDQYILNILYHPRIRPGMTRDQVRVLLPEILPQVRAWVAEANRPRH